MKTTAIAAIALAATFAAAIPGAVAQDAPAQATGADADAEARAAIDATLQGMGYAKLAVSERYMKTPAQNPDGYARTSALTHAGKLSRPLLLIHGITDDNVHFAHTLALIEALYVHAKRAEVITLSSTHMVPDPKLSFAKEATQIDFFRQHL